MKKRYCLVGIVMIFFTCVEIKEENQKIEKPEENTTAPNVSVHVLGVAQDAGSPQVGCTKHCCKDLWKDQSSRKRVSSLGIIDPMTRTTWLLDATPDFKEQTTSLSDFAGNELIKMPDGVFLTHGHMGHYTGLMHLGREAMGANRIPVYAMPQMKQYLTNNGPWSQLVTLNNIELKVLREDSTVQVTPNLSITPFLVPHRGEYTETVGYKVESKQKKMLFIPDIDKWHKWDRSILEEIRSVDYAFLDATFFKNGEVGNRDMSEIPHPFVEESMMLFDALPQEEKSKVYFIHMNHTNPLLKENSVAQKEVLEKGYHIASQGLKLEL